MQIKFRQYFVFLLNNITLLLIHKVVSLDNRVQKNFFPTEADKVRRAEIKSGRKNQVKFFVTLHNNCLSPSTCMYSVVPKSQR